VAPVACQIVTNRDLRSGAVAKASERAFSRWALYSRRQPLESHLKQAFPRHRSYLQLALVRFATQVLAGHRFSRLPGGAH